MRINCPNCDAQYEVPDEVIPSEGRDVQCSNCDTTWTFEHPDHPDTEPEEPDPRGAAFPIREATDANDEEDAMPQAPLPGPSRRELDPRVADILREEAKRESSARVAEARTPGLEVQTDLGLREGAKPLDGGHRQDVDPPAQKADPPDATSQFAPWDWADTASAEKVTKPVAAPDPVSETAPEPVPDSPPDPVKSAGTAASTVPSRRDLLPDVEEINSTLRSTGDRGIAGYDPDPEAPARERRRRGFRRGFLLAVSIFAIALLVYQFAPEIAEAAPGVDPWLSAYVTWVDTIRVGLDQSVRDFLGWLDELSTPDI